MAAPVEALFDAKLKNRLEGELGTKVLHMDHALCSILDDKHSFGNFLRNELDLRSPRTHKVTCNDEVRKYNVLFREEQRSGKLKRKMILKNLSYDPIHRLDLFQLPVSDDKLEAYLERITKDGNPITESEPWQLQEFLARGSEYAAMIVVRSNRLVTMTCCPSSASQLNYIHMEVPSVRKWTEDFMAGLSKSEYTLTGQLCFDFMVLNEGNQEVAYPIECNPRVHTQCTIYNSDDVRTVLGSLLLNDTVEKEEEMIELLERDYKKKSNSELINVYWFYNEFFKVIPNFWLLTYNDSSDSDRRSKALLQDLPGLSKRAILIALVYAPAAIISLILLLPVLVLMYVAHYGSGGSTDLSDGEHLWIMMIKLNMFLNRLTNLDENIEGDFWMYDPLPFLAKNHVQVASRLLATIRTGVEWKKIDFAIGKVVEVGGD